MNKILRTPTFLVMGIMVVITIIAYIVIFTSDASAQALANWENKKLWVIGGILLNLVGVWFLSYRHSLMVKNHQGTIEDDDTWVVAVATLIYFAGIIISFATLTSQTIY